MKTALRFFTLLLSTFILQPSSFGQGPLPPPGAPAPTMKTLDQIDTHIDVKGEKRIDLQNAPAAAVTTTDANYHFVITQPGSYYLSANLGVTKPNGIHVTVAGVTVDLNGFQISRSTGSVGDGLTIDGAADHCTIKNGSVSGFGKGINSNARSGSVLQISVSGCTNTGITTGSAWEISGCKAHDNTGTGIFAGGGATLTNCTATNNQGTAGISTLEGCSLINCTAANNVCTYGINAGQGSSLTNCTARNNAGNTAAFSAGILTSDGCTLTHCAATSNTATIASTSAGIWTGFACTITACTAQTNSSANATPTGSTGVGIIAGSNSKVQNCSAVFNRGDGIRGTGDSSIVANVCANNGFSGGDGAGVHVTGGNNHIEGNNVTVNDRGIEVSAAGNLIIKNSARNNGAASAGNYVIVADNRYGPIIDDTATGSITANGKGPFTSTLTTTDPWANFSY